MSKALEKVQLVKEREQGWQNCSSCTTAGESWEWRPPALHLKLLEHCLDLLLVRLGKSNVNANNVDAPKLLAP